MADIQKLSNLYVASLRALYLVLQNSHWLTRGDSFYGDHLLFERLYQSSAELSDLAAEKCIGLFGEDGLDMNTQAELLAKLLDKYRAVSDLHTLCLKMHKDFLAFSQQFYDILEDEGELSLGMDDMIMSIASKVEEGCYLLQQSLEEAN